MTHISKLNNESYEIAINICPEDGKSYDIITIFKFPTDEEEEIHDNGGDYTPPKLIGWYFGEYDFEITETCIEDFSRSGIINVE
jgi:translation elongation factor EF-G